MSDLIAWLRGCLDDEERVARAASAENGPTWYVGGERDVLADNPSDTPYVACGPWGGGIDAATADHIARHDPDRVLARIAADRAILDAYEAALAAQDDDPHDETRTADASTLGYVVEQLAQPYAGRDGWREEWRA